MEEKYTVNARIEKPFIAFPTHTKEFMNKVNERASGTHPKYVGVIDEVFYDYYVYCSEQDVEMTIDTWRVFHKNNIGIDTDGGKKAIKKKLKEMKKAIASITDEMIDDWYEFFLYNQTFYGKHMEFLIKEYFESVGLEVVINRPIIGQNKIDMIVQNLNIQVKPYNSRNPSMNRPVSEGVIYVYYQKKNNGISFFWDSKELDQLINERNN